MASEWFYQAMGQQVGPVSSADLRNLAQRGTIAGDTFVRKGSDGAWVPAQRVQGLFPEPVKARPPMPVTGSAPVETQPTQSSAAFNRGNPATTFAAARLSRHAVAFILAGSLALIVLIGAIIVATTRSHDQRHEAESAPVSKATPPAGTQSESGQASKATFAVGTPEHVVEQYAKATSWQERLQYVKQTKGIQEKMSQRYGNKPIQFEYDQIKKCDSTGAAVGSVVTVEVVESGPNAYGTIVKEIVPYYLERTSQGYLILWEPSVKWLPLGWSAYLASRPEQPMTFPLECELSDSYSGTMEKIERTHYSLNVKPPREYRTRNAFVVRESPAGRIVFETLKDGQTHRMLLAIQFRKDAKNILGDPEDCVWVSRLVSDKPWVYDDTLADRCTSPILVPHPQVQAGPAENLEAAEQKLRRLKKARDSHLRMADEIERRGREYAIHMALMKPIEREREVKDVHAVWDGTATLKQYKAVVMGRFGFMGDKRELLEQRLREKNLLAEIRRGEKPRLTAPISYVGDNMEEFVGKYGFFDDVTVHDDLAKQGDGFRTVRVEDSRGGNYSGLASDRSDRIVFVCSKPLSEKLLQAVAPYKEVLGGHNSRIYCDIHLCNHTTAQEFNLPPVTETDEADRPICGIAEIFRIEFHGRDSKTT